MDFARLFAADNNKDQGAFATAMYAQHWREIQAYAEGVTAAARSAGGGKGGPAPLSAVRKYRPEGSASAAMPPKA